MHVLGLVSVACDSENEKDLDTLGLGGRVNSVGSRMGMGVDDSQGTEKGELL